MGTNPTSDDGDIPAEPPDKDEGAGPRWRSRAQAVVWVLQGALAAIQLISAGVGLHWW